MNLPSLTLTCHYDLFRICIKISPALAHLTAFFGAYLVFSVSVLWHKNRNFASTLTGPNWFCLIKFYLGIYSRDGASQHL